jgi:radical SAM superfamily enzyme YgiQ (UPF0313 family)
MAMILDNNFCGDIEYAKSLLREIKKLDLWALGVQFSFNFLHDDEFVDLLCEANCGLAFIGLESLNEPSLRSVHKLHNRVQEYGELFSKLRKRGILTFTGMILALDEDTPEYYKELPAKLEQVDPSAILLSIAIPIPGTPLHKQMEAENRIFDHDLSHYEGDHLVFNTAKVSAEDVFDAFRDINRQFYSWGSVLRRLWRFIRDHMRNRQAKNRLFRTLVMSVMMLRLSLFQRHHAKKRVYPMRSRLSEREDVTSHVPFSGDGHPGNLPVGSMQTEDPGVPHTVDAADL